MEMSTSSSLVEEFYNKCHSKRNGKFCNTPGTGNVKNTSAAKAKAKASDAKNGVGPSAKKSNFVYPQKKAPVAKKAATPAPKKEAPKSAPVKAKTAPKPKAAAKPVPTKAAQPKATTKKKVSVPDSVKKDVPEKALVKAVPKEKQLVKAKAKSENEVEPENVRRKMFDKVVKERRLGDEDPFGGVVAGFNIAPPPAGVRPSRLSEDEIAAAMAYRSEFGYKRINGYLRNPEGHDPDDDHVTDAMILDGAFFAASPTTQDITVMRALGTFKPPKGASFTDKAFVSTTYDKIPDDFRGQVIKIVIPKGTRVLKLSGDGSESASEWAGESEILLPPGGSFSPNPDGSYRYTPGMAGFSG